VFNEIIKRVQSAKYYSISVDSSPDEARIDQLTVTIRYLENSQPVERFVTFLPNVGHRGQQMANALINYLKDVNINLQDCRAQAYDNAPNMAGKYEGMKTHILKENSFSIFIPCSGHSLNLVGKAAANTCSQAVDFFNFVEGLFNFFTAGTSRVQILTDKLSHSGTKKDYYILKRLSDTRWFCRADLEFLRN